MAAAAVPLLEAASKALLATIGVLGGAAAIEQAQKKVETQSDAKATAQPVAPSRTRSACQMTARLRNAGQPPVEHVGKRTELRGKQDQGVKVNLGRLTFASESKPRS